MAITILPNPLPVSIDGVVQTSTAPQSLDAYTTAWVTPSNITSPLDILPSSISIAQNEYVYIQRLSIITNTTDVKYKAVLYIGSGSDPSDSDTNPVPSVLAVFAFTDTFSEIMNISRQVTDGTGSNRNLMLALTRFDGGSTSVAPEIITSYKIASS
jgi:hypothetical protein